MGVTPLRRKEAPAPGPEPARMQEVLDVAASMFAGRGYRGTSLNDIGEALGMNKASLYHYVRSKEDLLYRLILRAGQRLRDVSQDPQLARLPAVAALERLVREHCRVVFEHRAELGVLVHQRRYLELDADGEVTYRERVYVDHLKAVVARGIKEGTLRRVDPSLAVQLILDTVNGLLRWHRPDGRLGREAVTEQVWRYVKGGLAA
ncbi:MAG: TetR family transcriptional regulator [Burkholderiales bacterium]|nr:TetR family transcriptional regulator [Burkholderiales bacterium]